MKSWWELGEGVGYSGGAPVLGLIVCPHCGYKGNFAREFHKERTSKELDKTLHFEILKCNECLLYTFLIWSPSSFGGRPEMHGSRVYPPSLKGPIKAPEHWPEQVGRAWEQAHKSLDTESWDAAATMAGRSLQAAVRQLGAKPGKLKGEIDELGAKGILPKSMVDWAEEIRVIRNVGAHPDPIETSVDPDDAKDIVEFLDYFLVYSYNLPKQIQDYKARRTKKP